MCDARLTGSAIQMVEITNCIFVVAITSLAEEPRLSCTATAWVLNDHSLVEILVEFERTLTGLHELCWLWEVTLHTLAGSFACMSVRSHGYRPGASS